MARLVPLATPVQVAHSERSPHRAATAGLDLGTQTGDHRGSPWFTGNVCLELTSLLDQFCMFLPACWKYFQFTGMLTLL